MCIVMAHFFFQMTNKILRVWLLQQVCASIFVYIGMKFDEYIHVYCDDAFEYDEEEPQVWLLPHVCISIFVYIGIIYVYVL